MLQSDVSKPEEAKSVKITWYMNLTRSGDQPICVMCAWPDAQWRFDLCAQGRHAIEPRSVTPARRTQKLSRRGPPDRLKAAKAGMRAEVGCSVWFGVAGTIIKDHS